MTKLENEVRFLKMYAVVITVLFGVLAFSAFRQADQKTKFSEIDVERINIVEKDGKLKMVISNSVSQHPGLIEGITISRKRAVPGMIFFNEEGDECGGLVFDGSQKGEAGGSLTFDKFRHDQTVKVYHDEKNGQYSAGLSVWDRPDSSLAPMIEKFNAIEKMTDGPEKAAAMKEWNEIPAGAPRVMVGRDRDKAAVVRLADAKGRPRIKLSVDASGAPKIEFLDETGKVTYSLPQNDSADKK